MKIGILYICTGVYTCFWEEFYISCERFFLNEEDVEKEYYVFTDKLDIVDNGNPRIHSFYLEAREWPYNTLLRYHFFLDKKEQYSEMDYLFFFNANTLFVKNIEKEDVLPDVCGKELSVVQYYTSEVFNGLSKENPKSTAYIPREQCKVYVAGGMNGGLRDAFLKMSESIKYDTDIDLKNGIIARSHDQSHLNRYVFDHDNWRLLGPQFDYPEELELPFEPKLIYRDKSKYFDDLKFKNGPVRAKYRHIKSFVRRLIKSFLRGGRV